MRLILMLILAALFALGVAGALVDPTPELPPLP
jgi:hypothetical protein